MKRILVGVDGSEAAGKAARLAADIALRFGSPQFTLANRQCRFGLLNGQLRINRNQASDRFALGYLLSIDDQ